MANKNPMTLLRVHFGANTTWELPAQANVASFNEPLVAVKDLSEAVNAALTAPIEFPALNQAVVPGDKLVLAVDRYLP